MSLPLSRRALLSFRLGTGAPAAAGACDQAVSADPFASYDMAYAQVNEARPFLLEDARRLGIATENRSDLDIAREIFAKADVPSV